MRRHRYGRLARRPPPTPALASSGTLVICAVSGGAVARCGTPHGSSGAASEGCIDKWHGWLHRRRWHRCWGGEGAAAQALPSDRSARSHGQVPRKGGAGEQRAEGRSAYVCVCVCVRASACQGRTGGLAGRPESRTGGGGGVNFLRFSCFFVRFYRFSTRFPRVFFVFSIRFSGRSASRSVRFFTLDGFFIRIDPIVRPGACVCVRVRVCVRVPVFLFLFGEIAAVLRGNGPAGPLRSDFGRDATKSAKICQFSHFLRKIAASRATLRPRPAKRYPRATKVGS
jgi:hypothetical protein